MGEILNDIAYAIGDKTFVMNHARANNKWLIRKVLTVSDSIVKISLLGASSYRSRTQ